MKNIHVLILQFLLSFSTFVFATNDLTVSRPGSSITKPAYMDNSVLVVEPHGGYAEQSLYITYSDHGGFSGYTNVQITHRFELPTGAVINDMWLWIGDSIVQAVMVDTWKARHIYDSIVDLRRDPAYLFKNNNQYELRIFPLTGGSFRKAKINFFVPVTWIKSEPTIELPLKLLNSNNASTKPLNILFRQKEKVWGAPVFPDFPDINFTNAPDTGGFYYLKSYLSNTAGYNSLKLKYSLQFDKGKFFQSGEFYKGLNYFQYSISLKDALNMKIDSLPKKVLVALDLSGRYNKELNVLIPNLKNALKAALGNNDFFNVLVSGAGKIKLLSNDWLMASPNTIDGLLDNFSKSIFADSVQMNKKIRLFYADKTAVNGWTFSSIDSFAIRSNYPDLLTASNDLKSADVCVSYEHCFYNVPSAADLKKITANLDTFFINGGRFISYFNMDCNAYETVARHYIPSLQTIIRDNFTRTLYRNVDGNIGVSFPEYFDHRGNNLMQFSDQDVKVDVYDAQKNPAVISKKISNGLLEVCGFWLYQDDEPTRRLLSMPILGLNKSNSTIQLGMLLDNAQDLYKQSNYDKLFIISNSDSLVTQINSENFASAYLAGFAKKPVINSINLLSDNTVSFPSCTVNGVTYAGSGYLLKTLTQKSGGVHFERQLYDWPTINSLLTPYSLPSVDSISVTAKGDNSESKITDFYEISAPSQDPLSPRNFVGSTLANESVSLQISAKFFGYDTVKTVTFSDYIKASQSGLSNAQSTIIGNEKVKLLFLPVRKDTAAIVATALYYRLLCDYTALLALEPNDSIHFIHPIDESRLVNVKNTIFEPDSSLTVKAFPNPFNAQVTLKVSTASLSKISIKVYNILGELVKTISENEIFSGSKNFIWNTAESSSRNLSSGIYFVRVETYEIASGRKLIKSQKLVLLK